MGFEVRQAALPGAPRPVRHALRRALFAGCIVAAPALATWHALGMAAHLPDSAWTVPLLGLALLAGALGADAVTGLVHWACDTWGDERTPWVGDGLIRAFREHHRDPEAMLAHDRVEVNGEAAAAACGGFLVLGIAPLQAALAPRPLLYAALLSLVSFCALANQLHQWAHMCDPPAVVRVLQRAGLILKPTHHAVHHTTPFESGYCIATGWLNRPLDRIDFWRAIERAITRATGHRPHIGGSTSRED